MLRADKKDMLFNVMNSISPHPHNHALQPLKSELIEELPRLSKIPNPEWQNILLQLSISINFLILKFFNCQLERWVSN